MNAGNAMHPEGTDVTPESPGPARQPSAGADLDALLALRDPEVELVPLEAENARGLAAGFRSNQPGGMLWLSRKTLSGS